jgi:ADP-ribosylglycohydrolase
METLAHRFKGCLLGLAVGDALGTTLEFRTPGSFEPIFDIVGGGPFSLKPGEWTDDTSMALCLAESLIETGSFDALDQMRRYSLWASQGHLSSNGRCFDIGSTVADALRRFHLSGDPNSGRTDPGAAGNGSIMRLAPIPMFYFSNAADAIAHAAKSSRTTHRATACVDACRYFGGLIWGALNGISKDELLSPRYSPLGDRWQADPLCPLINEIAEGSFKSYQPPAIHGTGYVVKSLEAALWAFHQSDDFRSGCLLEVNLGDDADTTGAVYGQLAGAFYGKNGIPSAWRDRLARTSTIEEFASRLGHLD